MSKHYTSKRVPNIAVRRAQAEADQRRWIAERGGSAAGYVLHYAVPSCTLTDGGPCPNCIAEARGIFDADIQRLYDIVTGVAPV